MSEIYQNIVGLHIAGSGRLLRGAARSCLFIYGTFLLALYAVLYAIFGVILYVFVVPFYALPLHLWRHYRMNILPVCWYRFIRPLPPVHPEDLEHFFDRMGQDQVYKFIWAANGFFKENGKGLLLLRVRHDLSFDRWEYVNNSHKLADHLPDSVVMKVAEYDPNTTALVMVIWRGQFVLFEMHYFKQRASGLGYIVNPVINDEIEVNCD